MSDNLTSPFAPAGFPELPAIGGLRLGAVDAGVRYSGRLDLMVAELAAGTSVAGVFTRSSTRSPAVEWSAARIADRSQRQEPNAPAAIIVNSGNANAFTGPNGAKVAQEMARQTAQHLNCSEHDVLVASTGVIGEQLPVERVTDALPKLAAQLGATSWESAARAIMTTDTFPKGAVRTCQVTGHDVAVAGIAKGSGMIAPNLGTMLAFLFTDAAIAAPALQAMLVAAVGPTFNSITVDSDCSTSDTVLLAATGTADHAPILDTAEPAAAPFQQALEDVMRDLAQQVVRDGEGASKFVTIHVTGAEHIADARAAAFAVANSPLVKTALAGEDPNWGRIVMAVGKSGARIDVNQLRIGFGDITVAERGCVAATYTEAAGAAYMKQPELEISIDLGLGGPGHATVWTCDLGHRYVSINADYRS